MHSCMTWAFPWVNSLFVIKKLWCFIDHKKITTSILVINLIFFIGHPSVKVRE
jgi:hypothetical protein